jgi:hypothetical protein
MSQFIDSLKKKQIQLEKEQGDLQRTINDTQQRLNAVGGALAGIHSLLRLEGVASEGGAALTNTVIQPGSGSLTLSGSSPPQLYDVVIKAVKDKKPEKAP